MIIKRGHVYLAALDPVVGREIAKTRPVVVVSNDLNNTYSGTVSIVPLTSKNTGKVYPFETLLKKGSADLPKDSKARADQIRKLDKGRLVRHFGELADAEMKKIDQALRIHLDIV